MTTANPHSKLAKTEGLPNPNKYVLMMSKEYSANVFDEDRAPQFKGKWRETFGLSEGAPLDLEIGTGNGYYFSHYCQRNPDRNLLGMEIKYKPLIQTIKR